MEKSLGDVGKKMAEKDRDEYQAVTLTLHSPPPLPQSQINPHIPSIIQVKEQLKVFQDLQPTDPGFDTTIRTLMADISQHTAEEENNDLPDLEKALALDESVELARSFGRTKVFVPIRSHPRAPNRPPFETVMGLLAAPIDRLGNLFRKYPKEKD
jgi:hypothetical protein